MTDVPETQDHRSERERGRLGVSGKRTDDGTSTTLLVVHELNGAWTFHGLGAPGIKLSEADTVAVREGILKRVRGVVR